ncbi:hypothetical protein NC653_014448 [Populus alba x Populus x berolinensis]|uniref:Uncharacterized protein n=1 Tax=Populus alba x Populus x berolinensis TaxID=444605 RepID=A0AAD6QXA8_9ROSI|nr:hypothetical protein NC653_014448 [Populus alba x Populus x berolinensis]
MARQLLLKQIPLSSSGLGLPAVTLLLCAFALFMCASHSRKWRRWSACYGPSDHDPVIQLNTVDTMLGTGEHGIHAGSREQVVSVWRKNILMGGNVVTPAKNPRPLLTWK